MMVATRARTWTSRRKRRTAALALGLVLLLALAACVPTPGPTNTIMRPADPVVITGASVAALEGSVPGDIVAFRNTPSGNWTQIPVQVDERKIVNFNTLYRSTAAGTNVNELVYADPNTLVGADPDPTLDANDEIAFMARDAGGKPTSFSEPTGVVHNSGVEVRLYDPLTQQTGAVYLFKRSNTSLDPSAGKRYVNYQFSLNSGDYKTTYKTNAGPNPENSTVTTPYYSTHFSDRWQKDALSITAGSATGVDILDRAKALFAPGSCGRSEDTFDAGEGAFIANTSGPVRAIRSYIGANSGPNTERTNVFYDQREDVTTDLRVHAIPSIMDFLDYSPAASGMRYSNSVNPNGVIVDGAPDAVAAGAPAWEKIDGAQGALVNVTRMVTNFAPPPTVTNYYLDTVTPTGASQTQCTGDAFAYGSSGLYVTSALPCTDPGTACTASLEGLRTMYFEAPGRSGTDASTDQSRALTPLVTTFAAWTG